MCIAGVTLCLTKFSFSFNQRPGWKIRDIAKNGYNAEDILKKSLEIWLPMMAPMTVPKTTGIANLKDFFQSINFLR